MGHEIDKCIRIQVSLATMADERDEVREQIVCYELLNDPKKLLATALVCYCSAVYRTAIKELQCAEIPSHLTKMEWKVSNCNCKFLDRGVSLYIHTSHTQFLLKYYIATYRSYN